MEKRPLQNRWASHQWRTAAVTLADAPHSAPPGDCIAHAGHELTLFRDEAEGYYLNLSSGAPMVFVMWRMEEGAPGAEGEVGEAPQPKFVTVSYNEAGRLMDAQETVETVPLPAPLLPWLEAYVAEHYKPEPKKKRARASFLSPQERDKL